MNIIALNSRLGNCGLVITAIVDCAQALGLAAMKQAVFHDAASEAFKEKSAFKRDSVYSEALSAHVVATITAKLIALGFEKVEIKTSAYEKPTDHAKFVKAMKGVGFDEKTIAEMWAKHPSNAKVEAKPEQSEPKSLS